MRKLKHVPGLIPDYVQLNRNVGALGKGADVLTDTARFIRFPNVDHNMHTCMYGDTGNRISITDTAIVMETVFQYQHGANPETEVSTSPWQSGVYHCSRGEAHLYSSREFPGAFSELQGIEMGLRAPIAITRTRTEMKNAIQMTWRLCYIARTGHFASNHDSIQLVNSKDPDFSRQYDLRQALHSIAQEMDELMVGFKPIDLKNPIAQYHWPEEGIQGYLSARLLDLIEQYRLVLEWVRATKNEKQGRLLLLMIDGDINTELQKLKAAVKREARQSKKESGPDAPEQLLRMMIDTGLQIKRSYREKHDIDLAAREAFHLGEKVGKYYQLDIAGIGFDTTHAFVESSIDSTTMLFSANQRECTPHIPHVIDLHKLMEPGYSLGNRTQSALVVYLIDTGEVREKILRKLRYVVMNWMEATREPKDLVILT